MCLWVADLNAIHPMFDWCKSQSEQEADWKSPRFVFIVTNRTNAANCEQEASGYSSAFLLWGLVYSRGLAKPELWISNYIQAKRWDEIAYLYINFIVVAFGELITSHTKQSLYLPIHVLISLQNNGWNHLSEWISTFLPHFVIGVIT